MQPRLYAFFGSKQCAEKAADTARGLCRAIVCENQLLPGKDIVKSAEDIPINAISDLGYRRGEVVHRRDHARFKTRKLAEPLCRKIR